MAIPFPPATSPAILMMEDVLFACSLIVVPVMVLPSKETRVSFFRSFQLPEPAPLKVLPPTAMPAPTETISESVAASPFTVPAVMVEPLMSAAMSFFT